MGVRGPLPVPEFFLRNNYFQEKMLYLTDTMNKVTYFKIDMLSPNQEYFSIINGEADLALNQEEFLALIQEKKLEELKKIDFSDFKIEQEDDATYKPGDIEFIGQDRGKQNYILSFLVEKHTDRVSLHGLWKLGMLFIDYDPKQEFDINKISSIREELEKNWYTSDAKYDQNFWQHEWEKHGRYTIDSHFVDKMQEFSYFKFVLVLNNWMHDLADKLVKDVFRKQVPDTNIEFLRIYLDKGFFPLFSTIHI